MSQLNRKQLKRMLLKEFKMMGMAPMGAAMIGHSPYQSDDHGHDDHHGEEMIQVQHGGDHKGGVSKEDCCKAVLCLIECCDCPDTKALIRECCEDILSRC
jgi:uncharacterized protein YggL (DUF469 family)